MNTKIIAILIVGIVAFTAVVVFSAEDYNSSRSNTSLVANEEDAQGTSASGVGDTTQADEKIEITVEKKSTVSVSDQDDLQIDKATPKLYEALEPVLDTTTQTDPTIQISAKKVVRFKVGADLAKTVAEIKIRNEEFRNVAKDIIENIRSAAPEERKDLVNALRVNRQVIQENAQALRQSVRQNAKELRENFRAKCELNEPACKGGRIAVAHGKGLRMINRFRSAIARFTHILGRLTSRAEKFEARGVDVSSVIVLLEEAKNTSVGNESKLEELKVKYELLLEGENIQKVGEDAHKVAKELKKEIQVLHAKLRDIVSEIKLVLANFNSSRSNKSEN